MCRPHQLQVSQSLSLSVCVFDAMYTNCLAFVELGCVCVAKRYMDHVSGKQAKASVFNRHGTMLNHLAENGHRNALTSLL